MHVEGDGSAATQDAGLTVGLRRGSPAALQEVVGQTLGQVSLSCPAGPRQNETSVLQQQADVVQHHRLRNHSLKHQWVNTVFSKTLRGADIGEKMDEWMND